MIIKDNQTILIPIDFTKNSYIAVKQSYNLAKFTKSKLLLLYVSSKSDTDRIEELQELAKSTTQECGIECAAKVKKGEILTVINQVATEIDCSLTIFAIPDNAKFKTGLFGGGETIPKFLMNSPCHVITFRNSDLREGCKNIILPFDLSAESREKVSFAVQLAHFYKADIKILSIFKPDDEEYENQLFPYLQQVKKFIKQEGISCTNRTMPSSTPAESIVEYAVKSEGDMIIQINQKDLSLGEKLGGGSLGHKLVEISTVPVLNVNPMKRESMSHFSSGM